MLYFRRFSPMGDNRDALPVLLGDEELRFRQRALCG